jgi:hypothetical protein
MRLMTSVLACALIGTLVTAQEQKPVGKTWTTIKGQVVFPANKPLPKPNPLNVNTDATACLAKGPLLDESALVNPKNRGVKNVVVYLRPLNPGDKDFAKQDIHPEDSKRKSAEVTITQPCCQFEARVTVARAGDTIVVKNPAAIVHNFFWSSNDNGNFNQNVPATTDWKMPQPLVAESLPISYRCTIHPWMVGYVRIFDHPYYAVTDADGKFEIKNAPPGKLRIVYWHETGMKGGKDGRFGEVIKIEGPTMEMRPVDFAVGEK